MKRAYVIGSGVNGLAAAIVMAQARLNVQVFEAESEPGGATRTMPLTLPGFLHDFGSAVFPIDRKSTRLNSSHLGISYAVFCLKKKNANTVQPLPGERLATYPPDHGPLRAQ